MDYTTWTTESLEALIESREFDPTEIREALRELGKRRKEA